MDELEPEISLSEEEKSEEEKSDEGPTGGVEDVVRVAAAQSGMHDHGINDKTAKIARYWLTRMRFIQTLRI